MRKYFFCGFYLLCFTLNDGSAQTPVIETLKKKISIARTANEKLKALLDLCEQRQSLSSDTLFHYAGMAKQAALANNDERNSIWADYYITASLVKKGELDSSIAAIDAALTRASKYPADPLLGFSLSQLKATVLIRKNQYKEALAEYYSLLHQSEQTGDTAMHIVANSGIGWVYMEMEQYPNAIRWFYKSIHTTHNQSYFKKYPQPYSNIAATYNSINKNDSAEYFIKMAIAFSQESQNLSSLANSLNILADIYIDTGRKPLAEKTLNEALKIREQIGDPFYIVSDMTQMAIFYASNQQPIKGIELCNKGIAMANQYRLASKLPILYQALAENYKATGNYKKYSETLKNILTLKDSLYKINSAGALAEMQTKYDVQQQENIIARQKFDLEKNNYLFYGSLLLSFFVIVFFGILFNEYKKRQKLKIRMMAEEEKSSVTIAVTIAEENQRKRIAADIHDNLGVKANAILYSTELLQQDKIKNETILSDLRDTAKDMLLTLRETLWAMKTADVEAADMWMRVINFSKQMTRYYPYVKIITTGAAPQMLTINSGVALNVLLIMQEAVNNAARHATATNITIKSEVTPDCWQMQVEDDGIGFDVEAMRKKQDSYGLNNMIDRAKTANLYIEVKTQPLQGTIVIIKIPRHKMEE